MGHSYSTKSKHSKKSRNGQSGNFIILVDSDDIYGRSVLEKPSVVTIRSQMLPFENVQAKSSRFRINNLQRDQKVNSPKTLSSNSFLAEQSFLNNKISNRCRKHTESEIQLHSLSLSTQQRRQEKIKKSCMCKFIITSDASTQEETVEERLKPTDLYLCKNTSSNNKTISKHNSTKVSRSFMSDNSRKHITCKQADQRTDKQLKMQNTDTTKGSISPTTSFYKYENSRITMLSSVLKVPTQERLKREFGGPLPHTKNHKDHLRRHNSESLYDLLENNDGDDLICPFCGATAPPLFPTDNTEKLNAVKPTKAFVKNPDKEDNHSLSDSDKICNLESLKEAKQQCTITIPLKKSRACNVNFSKFLKDGATSTPTEISHKDSFNITEKLLTKQYIPEKLYIALKKTETAPGKYREQEKHKTRTIIQASEEYPNTTSTESCKDETPKLISEQPSAKSKETLMINNQSKSKFYDNSITKILSRLEDSCDTSKENSEIVLEKKSSLTFGKTHNIELPKVTSSYAQSKSARSKLDKLIMENVNKSSFKPTKVPHTKDTYSYNNTSESNKLDISLSENKPSKIILEISGSALPRSFFDQLSRSHHTTYISSQDVLPEELLKPLTSSTYHKSSKKDKSHKSTATEKTILPQTESKNIQINKSTIDQLTQTNIEHSSKPVMKHLQKSQVFLSSIKTQPLKNIPQTFFEELHKFHNQTHLPEKTEANAADRHKPQNHLANKLIKKVEGSVLSTSGESISQVSDKSEIPAKFLSDMSNTSQIFAAMEKLKSRSDSEPYDYKTIFKNKNMVKHLGRIKEFSGNESYKSLSSSASDVSLTLKERQLYDKPYLSDQYFRAQHKLQSDEVEIQNKQKKQKSSPTLKDRNLPMPKATTRHRQSVNSKYLEVKEQTSMKDSTDKSKSLHLNSEEGLVGEDFRKPSTFHQKQSNKVEVVMPATGEPDRSLPSTFNKESILKQRKNESKPDKPILPVTFLKECHMETHYSDESDAEKLMESTTSSSNSELSQILEEPYEEDAEKTDSSPLSAKLKTSHKKSSPASLFCNDLWKYEGDPSVKFIQLLEKKYHKKFKTMQELMEKPPKDIISFIEKGQLKESPRMLKPIKKPIDYKKFLYSMTSGV